MTTHGKFSQSGSRKALMVFMKYPEAGAVKSRLAGSIGESEALRLYQRLVRRTLGTASDFGASHESVDLFLFYHPPNKRTSIVRRFPGHWQFVPQADGHLGTKMRAAFSYAFEKGYHQALLIGTDIADLTGNDMEGAFRALENHEAVLGPARDGGYYLIGLKTFITEIFDFSTWSVPSVFEKTLRRLRKSGHSVGIISQRKDIDRKEDLVYVRGRPFFHERVSIIIPFLNKKEHLASLVDTLEAQLWPEDEIILVKARSSAFLEDDPGRGVWRAESGERESVNVTSRTRLCLSPRGRGIQLNRGFNISQGDLLFFLHADTEPPPNFGYHVRKLSVAPDTALGCFQLGFSSSHPMLKLISKWANLRTKYLKLPYGDQGLFCHRHIFERTGGFKMPYLMEDVDFVRSCRKMGRLLVINQPVRTSARRYLQKGILRTSWLNHVLMLLYLLGMSDKRLYKLYYRPY